MKKILVVDDDEDVLLMLKTFLQLKGYETVGSHSCAEGLDIFYAFRPDVVILDVNVGTEDGREMCRKIKEQAEYRHIPVVMISANSSGLKSYSDYGANAALEKPFNFSKLVALIDTAWPSAS